MSESDFVFTSVARGLKHGEFDHLKEADKKKLIRLFSRISESSYRRGFQHGQVIKDQLIDAFDLRFNWPLDKAPCVDSNAVVHTSIDRLFMEYRVLSSIGFCE